MGNCRRISSLKTSCLIYLDSQLPNRHLFQNVYLPKCTFWALKFTGPVGWMFHFCQDNRYLSKANCKLFLSPFYRFHDRNEARPFQVCECWRNLQKTSSAECHVSDGSQDWCYVHLVISCLCNATIAADSVWFLRNEKSHIFLHRNYLFHVEAILPQSCFLFMFCDTEMFYINFLVILLLWCFYES